MGRDYAPRSNSSRRQTQSKRGGLPGWVWLIAGLSAGLAVAAFIYIARPGGLPDAAAIGIAQPEAARPAAGDRKKQGPLAIPPKEKARFTFYELLPNQEVVIPREYGKAASAPATPAGAAASYVIQVASFRKEDDAERQKASLALLGIESRIETVTIDQRDTYYRVRVGPVRDWDRVQMLMARLEENGIQSLLVKVQ